MQVSLDVTRRDIAWFNISKLLRLKSNLQVFAIVLVGVSIFAWLGASRDGGEVDWFLVAVSSFGGAIVGFALIFVFSLAFVLLGSTTRSGVLGTHTYTIEDLGLREQTEANDTLNYWPAIQKIEKSRTAIVVQINAWLFHVLPRRAFDSEQQYDAFYNALKARIESSTD